MPYLHTTNRNSAVGFWRDDCGLVVSFELLLVGLIVVMGMIVGLASLRDSMVSELSDVAGSVQDLNQSFAANGTTSTHGTTAGSDFFDQFDIADDTEDPSGAADNGITFDFLPTEESVSTEALVTLLSFNGNADDISGSGNDGILRNGASIVDGNLVLDGVNDFVTINNTTDINLGTHEQRTIHVEFTPTEVTSRQLIYEEGGGIRGFNIYIEDGQLYLGAYNIPETNFRPTYLSTSITAGQTVSATIVLDAGPTITADSFSGFVNGSLIGSAPATQLFGHAGGIGIGGANGNTVFHSGGSLTGFVDGSPISTAQSASGAFFGGTISGITLFNRPLTAGEIGSL